MLSVQSLYENWNKVSRILYVHKLISTNEIVDKSLLELHDKGIVKNLTDVYLYTMFEPDTRDNILSFTGSNILTPGITSELFSAIVSPINKMFKKGNKYGTLDFNENKLSANDFTTSNYLYSKLPVKFKKIIAIPVNAISTTIDTPTLMALRTKILYDHYDIDCDENKFNITNINIKRFKAWTSPQILTKANYVYTYKCIVK